MNARAASVLVLSFVTLISQVHAVKFLVPAYWDPDCDNGVLKGSWAQLIKTPHPARITVILNTNNGPGYPADGPDPLLQCIPALRKAGITLLGYVHTSYGARPASVVLNDIARWKAAYAGVQGIFIDEASGWYDINSTSAAYYKQMVGSIRNAGFAKVAANPGSRIAPQMLNLVDIIVGFESPASDWTLGGNQGICPQPNFITTVGDPGYCSGTAKKPQYCTSDLTLCKSPGSTEFSMISICTPSARWKVIANQATAAGYTYLYITEAGCDPNNAYNGLPANWALQGRSL